MIQQTSLLAFEKNAEEKDQNRKIVFSCLHAYNSLTAWEVTLRVNRQFNLFFHRNNVQPRLNELVKQGLVVVDGKKRCPVAKQDCLAYRRF